MVRVGVRLAVWRGPKLVGNTLEGPGDHAQYVSCSQNRRPNFGLDLFYPRTETKLGSRVRAEQRRFDSSQWG